MMIHKNFAERIFVDLRNRQIKIANPIYVLEGAKIGQFPEAKQLVISGFGNKYKFSYGPGINFGDEVAATATATFTSCYDTFLNELLLINKKEELQFLSLVIPKKGVIEVKLEEFNDKVVSRYIKDYIPAVDDLSERWDILVQAV